MKRFGGQYVKKCCSSNVSWNILCKTREIFFFKDSKPISCQTAGKKPQIYGSPKDMEVHNCLCFAENGIVDKVR